MGRVRSSCLYRGLANFPVPIAATTRADGTIDVRNTGSPEIASTILFENYGGRVSYRLGGALGDTQALARPVSGDLASLRKDLQEILIANGLYPREAAAMLETWRDSWFTEGTRLFYVIPPAAVDTILPLDIEPRPAKVARVFVGRIEVITPATEEAVLAAITGTTARRWRATAGSSSRSWSAFSRRGLPISIKASAQLALRMIAAWQASAERSCR